MLLLMTLLTSKHTMTGTIRFRYILVGIRVYRVRCTIALTKQLHLQA